MESIEIMRWFACAMVFTIFTVSSFCIYMYYCNKSGKEFNTNLAIIPLILIALIGMMPIVFINYDTTLDDFESLPGKIISRWSDKFNENNKEPLIINNETEGNSTLRSTTYYNVIYNY